MARDLVEAFPAARAVFDRVDVALGSRLSTLCFEGPAEELTLTHSAQPALLAHAAAVWAVARERLAPLVRGAAGHSLGEFSAYHAAGSLPLEDAVKLVRRRGELMLESGVTRPGTMAAILGGLQRSIDEICREAGSAGVVVPANLNTAEQVVISGEIAAVERTMAGEHPGALFVEMGPVNVLTGLLKRLAPDHKAATCGTVAEVESLLKQVS